MKTFSLLWSWPEITVRRTRILTGLVMFTFLSMHLANHAAILVSLETAERARRWFSFVWGNPVGTVLFYGSVLVHVILALRSLYMRRTLRMPPGEAAQFIVGLAIPLMIMEHAAGIFIPRILYNVHIGYESVIRNLWINSPLSGLRQSLAVILIWLHGCLGLYFFMRYRSWYPRIAPYLLALAVLLPVLALLGFADGGRTLEAAPVGSYEGRIRRAHEPPQNMNARVATIKLSLYGGFSGAIGLVLVARGMRSWRRRSNGISIRYDHGALARAPRGASLLEASRMAGIAHYSACGGKGRCSTCRVRIVETAGALPEPGAVEKATLQRIHADPDVRLGCQLRPEHDLSVALILAPQTGDDIPAGLESVRPGREAEIAVLFCDIRNFTAISETRLPYDVVFLLNRYFAIVGQAVEQAGGRLDKFIGDGAMALFGLHDNSDTAARDALRAAAGIMRGLARLNDELREEFGVNIRVAIGIHAGPAIVGVMGHGTAKGLTAIGDTVNVASRLENAAKDFDISVVISDPAITQSGADTSGLESRQIDIRGRKSQMRVFLVSSELLPGVVGTIGA